MSQQPWRNISQFSQAVQENNHRYSQFSQQTEALAQRLGCLLGELPLKIGISERMFYGYRSGKYPITGKAWRKLEAAEREAGMSQIQTMGDAISLEQRQQRGEALSISEEADLARVREDVMGSVSEDVLNEIRRNYKLFRAWIAAPSMISPVDGPQPMQTDAEARGQKRRWELWASHHAHMSVQGRQ